MAFSSNQKNSRKRKQAISDINITPFVDVLLVLLIIFMVAAPMMTSSVNLDLPKGSNQAMSQKIQPITISIKSDGSIFLQDQPSKLTLLPSELLNITGNNLDSKILIRADSKLDYGRVMEVVRIISIAGFTQVVLLTQMAQ